MAGEQGVALKLERDADDDGNMDVNDDVDAASPQEPPVPRKGGGKGKKDSRHLKRAGKGMKRCKACLKDKPEHKFQMNQEVDEDCKKFLDNIAKQARNQGEDAVAWFKSSKADPAKCKKMIEAYEKEYQSWTSRGKKGGVQWAMVTYMQEVEASTTVAYEGEFVMMWERQATEFWQTIAGGSMMEEEASSKWLTMSAQKDHDATPHDMKGPPKKPLRLAVKVADKVVHSNAFKRSRKLVMEEKGNKNASQEEIDRLVKKAMTNHDATAQAIEAGDVTRRMVSSGSAGDAFAGVGMNMDDVTNLLPDAGANDEDDSEAEAQDEDAASLVDGSDTTKGKNKVWFDRDRSINQALKLCGARVDKLKFSCADRVDKLRAALEEVGKMSAVEQRHFTGEERIARVRLVTLEKLNESAQELDNHIKGFKCVVGSPVKKGGSAGDGTVGLGNAPPCSQYELLLPMAMLEATVLELNDCHSQDEITEKKKTINSQHAPIADLLQSVLVALNDINKVKKSRQQATQQAPSAGKPQSKALAAAAAAVNQIFNELIGSCTQMQSLRIDEFKARDVKRRSVPKGLHTQPQKPNHTAPPPTPLHPTPSPSRLYNHPPPSPPLTHHHPTPPYPTTTPRPPQDPNPPAPHSTTPHPTPRT